MLVAKKFKGFSSPFAHVLKVFICILVEVTVDFSLSWLVNLWGFFLGSNFDVFSNLGSFDSFDIENKANQALKSFSGSLDNILVSDNMGRNVLVEPPLVEFIPYSYIGL